MISNLINLFQINNGLIRGKFYCSHKHNFHPHIETIKPGPGYIYVRVTPSLTLIEFLSSQGLLSRDNGAASIRPGAVYYYNGETGVTKGAQRFKRQIQLLKEEIAKLQ